MSYLMYLTHCHLNNSKQLSSLTMQQVLCWAPSLNDLTSSKYISFASAGLLALEKMPICFQKMWEKKIMSYHVYFDGVEKTGLMTGNRG